MSEPYLHSRKLLSTYQLKNIDMKSFKISVLSMMFLGLATSCYKTDEPKDVMVEGISLEPSEVVLSNGETAKLTYTIFPENATNPNVIWLSQDEEIAVVDAEGTVTAKSSGNTVITVMTEDGGFEAKCDVTVEYTGTYQGRVVKITAGTFMMGSPTTEEGRQPDETQHEVKLTQDFYMTACEITNAEYCAFANAIGVPENKQAEVTYIDLVTGSEVTEVRELFRDSKEPDLDFAPWGITWDGEKWVPMDGYEEHPMVYVSWYGAIAYANWVGGTLPTEAQWEYACRAGSTSMNPFGVTGSDLDDYVWHKENSGECSQPVGQKKPNAWGLYDMIGNVWEWCYDYYGEYGNSYVVDPIGTVPSDYQEHSMRGSSFRFTDYVARSSVRYAHSAWRTFDQTGFRVIFIQE